MRRWLVIALVALHLTATPPPPAVAESGLGVLVALRPRADAAAVVDGAGDASPLPHRPDILRLAVPSGRSAAAVAAALARRPDVRWAAPEVRVQASAVPADPGFVAQWHLQARAAQPHSANWEPTQGSAATGSGVTVAVIDTGVTPNEDLTRVQPGFDFVDDDNVPNDENGHGTHVAGTVAQDTGNGVGVSGVAPQSTVLAIRVLDASGGGPSGDIISAIALATESGADVINLSLGGPTDGGLCEAVALAVSGGTTVVAAAGNEAAPVGFPAACPEAIGVSASTRTGALASYSNRGPEIDLAAPGGDLTVDSDGDGYRDGVLQFTSVNGAGGYYFMAGTSMAAPHVAGAAALLRSVDPELTPAATRTALEGTASDRGAPGRDPSFGSGLLDITAALGSLDVAPVAGDEGSTEEVPPTTTAPTSDTSPTTGTVSRIAGGDRFATAGAVSATRFSGGSPGAFVASGREFADALALGPLGRPFPAPLLLSEPCELPEPTLAELRRLSPTTVGVIGGEQSICPAVASRITNETGARVERVGGADRFATAAELAAPFQGTAEVYLASGRSFPDGLAGGPRAALVPSPLLLTETCSLPAATRGALDRLRPRRATVLGGVGVVCDAVLDEVRALGIGVRRIAGGDRYETAAAVVDDGFPERASVVYVASGESFPDALSVGVVAASLGAPVLLTRQCEIPDPVRQTLLRLEPNRILVVGGPTVVCDRVLAELEAYTTAG